MRISEERLNAVYDKTDGRCHICHCKLSFKNYGKRGTRGAWHVDHSIPKALGGSDHLNNLYAACIDCNQEKGISSNRSVRNRNGVSRAPYSKAKKESIREENTLGGIITGGSIGILFGPVGMAVGAVVGGIIGESFEID